jgi:hypothetical protein
MEKSNDHQFTTDCAVALIALHGRMWAWLSILAFGAAGCTGFDRPATVFEPTEVGAIESIDGIRDMRFALRLEQGVELEIDLSDANYEPASRTPNSGDLLLYVEDVGGKPWVLALSGEADCFMIQGRAIDEGDHLLFETGLRLPKAADYDPGYPGPLEEYSDQAHFCLDREGVVTHFAGSPG